jgi:hypothetical protein
MEERLASFDAFWPYYVSQHHNPANRRLHFVGTSGVLLCLAASLLVSPYALILAPLCGYGFAWVGHFFVERNRPATFQYPLWSLLGDFRMFFLMALGRMGPEVRRAETLFPPA